VTGPARGQRRSQVPPQDQLAAIGDLSSLAAALCFPGATTRLDAGSTPPRLNLRHPQVAGLQRITAEGDFFCWRLPARRIFFGLRGLPIDMNAGEAAVLLAYLIAGQAGLPFGWPHDR
jgi:hypothetical protein